MSSTKCNHCYEKEAILRLLGNRNSINCPVAGCKGKVTKDVLVEDSDMMWKVVGSIFMNEM